MKLAFAFIKWIFKQIGKGILSINQDFRDLLSNQPGLGLFAWFICSLLSSVAMLLLLAGVQYVTRLDIPVQVWFTYIAACVIYLLYTAFNLMYTAFKAERAELFETIKNGR